MNTQDLVDTANALVADDKGLLAMDESNPTCNKRFAKLGIPQTEEARRAYRELIVTTPISAKHQRRDPLRRDDPPAEARRHSLGQSPDRCGNHFRHQSGRWCEGDGRSSRREDNRRPRRIAGPSR